MEHFLFQPHSCGQDFWLGGGPGLSIIARHDIVAHAELSTYFVELYKFVLWLGVCAPQGPFLGYVHV